MIQIINKPGIMALRIILVEHCQDIVIYLVLNIGKRADLRSLIRKFKGKQKKGSSLK